jgi:hypothetical protein
VNVFGDDPFTDDVVEPSLPFNLAVMFYNGGAGMASNLQIVSGQPEIIENEKGLLVDFEIIQSRVNYQAFSPSLALSIGDVAPSKAVVAQWDLVCSLQGEFKDFNATYQYVTPLGDARLSVVENLTIHALIHIVRDQANEDGVPDFLTDSSGDLIADTLHSSLGNLELQVSSFLPADVTVGTAFVGNDGRTVVPVSIASTINTPIYIRVTDPMDDDQTLSSVIRADSLNSSLPIENYWRTHRVRRGAGNTQTVEDWVHLYDYASAGTYYLHFGTASTVTGLVVVDIDDDLIAVRCVVASLLCGPLRMLLGCMG